MKHNKKGATGPKRSEKYYMDTVVFKVENTLFRVPKTYFVKNSVIFRDMFSLPQPGDTNLDSEGASDRNPLVLEDVKAEEFERLLTYIYPQPKHDMSNITGVKKPKSPDPSPFGQILPLIKLAKKWMLRGLHADLVGVIESLPMEMDPDSGETWIVDGKEYAIPSWIRRGYELLADQQTPMSLHQAQQIGWNDAVRIFHLREHFARPSYSQYSLEKQKQDRIDAALAESLRELEKEFEVFYGHDPGTLTA